MDKQPREILILIFSIHPSSWPSIARVCREWHATITNHIQSIIKRRGEPPESLRVFAKHWLFSSPRPQPTLAEFQCITRMIKEEAAACNDDATTYLREMLGRMIRCELTGNLLYLVQPTLALTDSFTREIWLLCAGVDVVTALVAANEIARVAMAAPDRESAIDAARNLFRPRQPAPYDAETKMLDRNVEQFWQLLMNGERIENIHMSPIDASENPAECAIVHPNDVIVECRNQGRCLLAELPEPLEVGVALPPRYIRLAIKILLFHRDTAMNYPAEESRRIRRLLSMVSEKQSRKLILAIAVLIGLSPQGDVDTEDCSYLLAAIMPGCQHGNQYAALNELIALWWPSINYNVINSDGVLISQID